MPPRSYGDQPVVGTWGGGGWSSPALHCHMMGSRDGRQGALGFFADEVYFIVGLWLFSYRPDNHGISALTAMTQRSIHFGQL